MEKWINNLFLKDMRKLIDQYQLIEKNDKILIAVSGGKDSTVLMYGLHLLKKYNIYQFDYKVIIINNGFLDCLDDYEMFLKREGISYDIINDFYALDIVSENNKSVCYTCARLRKGILKRIALEEKYNKIALGHTKDDVVETFIMNITKNGKLASIPPKRQDDDSGLMLIRPLLLVDEREIIKVKDIMNFPIVLSTCERGKDNLRLDMDQYIRKIEKTMPDIKDKVISGLQNVEVKW